MKRSLTSVCMLLSGGLSMAAETPREWTSVDGRKIEAVMRNASAREVTLLPTGGARVVLPLARLSQADQDYVNQQALVNDKSFSLEVLGSRIVSRESFFRSGAVDGPITAQNPEGSSMIAGSDDMIVEVKARMLPAKMPGGNQTLDFANVRIVHRNKDKTEDTEPAGPRWQAGVKGQGPPQKEPQSQGQASVERDGLKYIGRGSMGMVVKGSTTLSMTFSASRETPKTLEIQDGKPIDFTVAFAIPKDSAPIALSYEGVPPLEVRLK